MLLWYCAGTADEKESAFSYKAAGEKSAIQAMAKTTDGWYVTDTESISFKSDCV